MAVLGVDGCKAGWVGVRLDDADRVGVSVAPTIADLVAPATDLGVVGIDMPIGLPAAGLRSIESAVRAELGRRRSSVFDVPPRAVFAADTHDEANEICHAVAGRRISRQTYALRRKVLEVDAWWRRARASASSRSIPTEPAANMEPGRRAAIWF